MRDWQLGAGEEYQSADIFRMHRGWDLAGRVPKSYFFDKTFRWHKTDGLLIPRIKSDQRLLDMLLFVSAAPFGGYFSSFFTLFAVPASSLGAANAAKAEIQERDNASDQPIHPSRPRSAPLQPPSQWDAKGSFRWFASRVSA
jgi:hypothetical protein